MKDEKAVLIVNPAAGYNTGKKIYKEIFKKLHDTFKTIDIKISAALGGVADLAKSATDDGYKLLIGLGGDGTSFETVNGMMASKRKEKPTVAFIPSGSGNSFLRDFDVLTPEQAVERIISGKPKKYDMIRYKYEGKNGTETAFYINILGTGFVARVAEMRLKYFRLFRSFGYTIGVLLQVIPLKRDNVEMIADGKKYILKNNFISVCNSRYTGGSMMMAPEAKLDDGKMDVIMLNDSGRWELLKAFPDIFKGTHIENEKVTTLQVKKVSVSADKPLIILVDGEVIGHTPLEAEVMHKSLSLLI